MPLSQFVYAFFGQVIHYDCRQMMDKVRITEKELYRAIDLLEEMCDSPN